MPLYQYPNTSPIDEVKLWRTKGGDLLGYVHAGQNVTEDTLKYTRLKIESAGLRCAPWADENGKAYLEVRGLKNMEMLPDILQRNGFATGQATVLPLPEDEVSASAKAGSRKIQLAGALYLGGDAFFTGHGMIKKYGAHAQELAKQIEHTSGGTPELLSSAFYALGSIFAVGFGKDQSGQRLQDVSRPLAQYLEKSLGHIPAGTALAAEQENDKRRGTGDKFLSFLNRYPSELMNMSFAFAGAMIALAAHQNTQDSKYHRILEGTLGVTTMLSGLAGTFIKEKEHDPDASKKHGMAKVWEYVQEHPLALAGYGLMASTVIHGVLSVDKLRISNKNIALLEKAVGKEAGVLGEAEANEVRAHIKEATSKWTTPPTLNTSGALTEDELKEAKLQLSINKSDLWEGVFRGVFVVSNVIAEILIATSSKGHGAGVTGDPSVEKTVFSMSAEAIVRQPANMRENLIQQVGAYISHPDILGGKPQQNMDKLREAVAHASLNPWAMPDISTQPSTPQNWQQKIETIDNHSRQVSAAF